MVFLINYFAIVINSYSNINNNNRSNKQRLCNGKTGIWKNCFRYWISIPKRIALDRGYNPSKVNKALFKLQNPRLSHPSHSKY